MDINDLLSGAKDLKGLDSKSALELFNSKEPIDFAKDVRHSFFSSAVTISVSLGFMPDQTLAELKHRACALADKGHQRVMLDMEEIGNHSPIEAIDSLLSIERKRGIIRRVDLKLPGNVSDVILNELNKSAAAVILPADSTIPLRARSLGIGDIGLSMHFSSEGYPDQLERLLHSADEINPRIILIDRDLSVSAQLFERLCQIIRLSQPMTALMIKSSEDLALTKYATSLLLPPTEKLDGFVNRIIRASMLPSLCTACKLEDRTGNSFLEDCRSGKIHNLCYLNALLSLKEFLTDFGSQDTRIVGTDMVLRELYNIRNDSVRTIMVKAMKDIRTGKRGSHF